jgi:hypothetical protein
MRCGRERALLTTLTASQSTVMLVTALARPPGGCGRLLRRTVRPLGLVKRGRVASTSGKWWIGGRGASSARSTPNRKGNRGWPPCSSSTAARGRCWPSQVTIRPVASALDLPPSMTTTVASAAGQPLQAVQTGHQPGRAITARATATVSTVDGPAVVTPSAARARTSLGSSSRPGRTGPEHQPQRDDADPGPLGHLGRERGGAVGDHRHRHARPFPLPRAEAGVDGGPGVVQGCQPLEVPGWAWSWTWASRRCSLPTSRWGSWLCRRAG